VIFLAHGLVGFPETDQVRRDDAMTELREPGDHVSIEEGPGRLSVQQENRWGSARPFVDVVHAKAVDFEVVRSEGIVREPCETGLRRANELDQR
jgi:hypothetical protein